MFVYHRKSLETTLYIEVVASWEQSVEGITTAVFANSCKFNRIKLHKYPAYSIAFFKKMRHIFSFLPTTITKTTLHFAEGLIMTLTHSQNSETEDLCDVQFAVRLPLLTAVLFADVSSTHLSVDGKANQSSYHVTEMLIRMIIRCFLFSASAHHFLVVKLKRKMEKTRKNKWWRKNDS